MEAQAFRQGFRNVFLPALDRATGCPAFPVGWRTNIERASDDIIERHRHGWPASRDPFNLEFAAFLIAAFQVLKPALGRPTVFDVIEAAVRSGFDWITPKVRAELDDSSDGFTLLTTESRQREANFFGEGFAFEHPADDASAYHLDVTRCWYVEICRAENVASLAPSFCAFDAAWYDAIVPARDGFIFRRPTTIAAGDDRCRFYFDRIGRGP